MDFLSSAKSQAHNLRLEVAALGAPAPITLEQSQNVVARLQGYKGWSDFVTKRSSRYFHDRHAPYLPNSINLVRALSTRKAALDDLADMERRVSGQEPAPSSQVVVAMAIERALRQARQLLQNVDSVAPDLSQALLMGALQPVVELQQLDDFAMQAYAKASTPDPVKNRRGLYQAFANVDEAQALAYHAAYVRWRLTTLAAALSAVCERQDQPAFAEMVTGGIDILAFVGAMLSAPEAKKLEREQSYSSRLLGQAVLMTIQTSGSMEPSLRVPSAVVVPDAEELGRQLLARFPEIAFWHAWVELKPVFVPGIDDHIV